MAFNIDDEETEHLIKLLAERLNVSLEDAVLIAAKTNWHETKLHSVVRN